MNSGVFKYIKILSWVLMVLGVASLVYLVVMSAVKPEPSMEFISSVGAAEGAGMIITYTYMLVALAVLLAVLFPVVNIFVNPKSAVRALIGLGGVAIILVGAYFLASGEPMRLGDGTIYDSTFGLYLSDMMLFLTYSAVVVAFLSIITVELRSAFK